MCDPVTLTALSVAATAVGAGVSYMNGQKQASAAKSAMAQEEKNAQASATQAEQAQNAANAQGPDTAAIEAKNQVTQQGGPAGPKGGGGATMLSGPTGVDPAALNLGKNTLLGGT